MSRNYNAGTRDMAQAGRIVLAAAAARRDCSFATVDAVADRWRQFVLYAKAEGVGRMERVTPVLVCGYGRLLATRVREGDMSPAYAQNLVSAVNSVMNLVCKWPSVSPTKDCGIPTRSTVRRKVPASLDQVVFQGMMHDLCARGLTRQAAVVGLARTFGLRSEEASLLNARTALQVARQNGKVDILDGTKGGRPRVVPVTLIEQIVALEAAAFVQGGERSMVPMAATWIQWRNGGLRDGREVLKKHGISGYHDLRASYACDRYQILTGQLAPVCQPSTVIDQETDMAARAVISRELGHDRIAVVAAYVGAR